MATRLYFSYLDASDIAPAYDGSWGRTTEAARRLMTTDNNGDSASLVSVWANGSVSANGTALSRQFITGPMAAGISFSTSNTIKGVVGVWESGTNDNINRIPVVLKVVSNDGSTVRATLKAFGTYGASTTEWATGGRQTRIFFNTTSLGANYTTVAGDRLVLEIGAQVSAAGGSTVTGNMHWGRDNFSGDHAFTETDTANKNPWIELDLTLTFIQVATVAGNQPAASGALAIDRLLQHKTLAGEQPAASGALSDITVIPGGVDVAGEQPAPTGEVQSLRDAAVAGDQDAPTGAVAIEWLFRLISLAGNQDAPSGVVTSLRTTFAAVAGDQDAPSGDVSAISVYLRNLAGNQDAPSGVVSALSSLFAAVAGDQDAPSGALSFDRLLQHVSVAGDQDAPTGALVVEWLFRQLSLAGEQPAATGTIDSVSALFVDVAGNQDAPSGDITIQWVNVLVVGNQDAPSGAVSVLVGKVITGDQPAATGVIVALVYTPDYSPSPGLLATARLPLRPGSGAVTGTGRPRAGSARIRP